MERTYKSGLNEGRFNYVNKLVIHPRLKELHPALSELINISAQHPRERWASTADQLLLYQSLTYMMNAKKILDCGTFTGLSALSFALGCGDDGHLYTIDINRDFVSIGQEQWNKAGVSHKITSIIQPAEQAVQQMLKEHAGTFDIAYLDCPKQLYEQVYESLVPLLRPRGLLLVDNIFMDKTVFEEESAFGEMTIIMDKFNKRISGDERMLHNFIDIGDGLAIAIKK
ncbi:putative caffeoyl-CoA O-methyltransferase 3 [Convolutriloba macropyga]|uniref:putative caffeoyl-CoA O-methyltransferase 3 n=1 Tax=Convolutriloba macropyga TaxID=536237 RepID=UPI003F5275ED